MGVSEAIKKQARRPEQACPRDDRHRASSIKFEVYGEFTGWITQAVATDTAPKTPMAV
jgi:hypothetical protein